MFCTPSYQWADHSKFLLASALGSVSFILSPQLDQKVGASDWCGLFHNPAAATCCWVEYRWLAGGTGRQPQNPCGFLLPGSTCLLASCSSWRYSATFIFSPVTELLTHLAISGCSSSSSSSAHLWCSCVPCGGHHNPPAGGAAPSQHHRGLVLIKLPISRSALACWGTKRNTANL